MRFKFCVFFASFQQLPVISFSFSAVYSCSSSLLDNTCNALYRSEQKKVAIIDFDVFCAVLFVHLFQSHLHDNYRRYFNWAAVWADGVFLLLLCGSVHNPCNILCASTNISGPVRLYLWCATCRKSLTKNIFFLTLRPRNKYKKLSIFERSGENEEEKWSKRRMEIYEPYLLLFRECFHIRYPRIKSSFSLRASDFLILTVARRTGEEKMKKIWDTRVVCKVD